MSRFPLEIEHYMSTALIVIAPSQPLSEAIRLMRLHAVRHLPVVTRKEVVGILSQRDIYLVQTLEPGTRGEISVSEAMSADPYTVEPDAPVDQVAREMARRKIGTALVTHGDQLLGMFTAGDALLALAALIEDESVTAMQTDDEADAPQALVVQSKRGAKSAPKRKRAATTATTATKRLTSKSGR